MASYAPTTILQSTRETRAATKSLPGKPERLIEEAVVADPKKVSPKKKNATPKKAPALKGTTPKVLKPTAVTKVTKKKSPTKPKAKLPTATIQKSTTAAGGKKKAAATTTKGKKRPRMAEEALPSPVGYHDSSGLHEALKGGVYRTADGWFDMKRMGYLDAVGRVGQGRGINI